MKSHMQRQREEDDAAEIEGLAEELAVDLRNELIEGGDFEVSHRDFRTGHVVVNYADGGLVLENMIYLSEEEPDALFSELLGKAVDSIIEDIDLEAVVAFSREQEVAA